MMMMDIKTDERPASTGSSPGTDDSRSEPDRERSPPPAPKLKMGALDIANMIAKHKPAPTSPITGGVSPTQVSPLGSSVKPLDLSQYSRLPIPSTFKGGFYPYQGGPSPPTGLPMYPYNPDAASSLSAAAANSGLNGTAALPMYSYPLTETVGSPSVSTLRLSALLASRKRRSTGSTSGDSNESEEKNLDASSRKKVRPVPEEKKDGAYWERRRKNNDAAKRSRDARRAKEEEIALRAVFLEQDNMKLRAEVSILKSELARLHYMVYNC
ncbi:LOW QUALITY PROTEIN: uncharacterized protein [Amphiura filiformis]|uniref:LOW QUALITY PROTEIN: uncharacterized protein n=1 Tax=Amphiura filiformis TaxID=82378 RepID=UPI003B217B13